MLRIPGFDFRRRVATRFERWWFSSTSATTTKTSKYRGVRFNGNALKKWSVRIRVQGNAIDGGEFWTEEDAAQAYDELAMIYHGKKATLNFSTEESRRRRRRRPDEESSSVLEPTNDNGSSSSLVSVSSEWQRPDKTRTDPLSLVPIRLGTPLELPEVLHALDHEKALDIHTIDLTGRSSLAEHMVFCTGRSRLHMRNMADLLVDAVRARKIPDQFDYGVEGRDCEDWMIVDLNTIIVHFLREDTRRVLNLENHWEHMKDNVNQEYGHMSPEEYIANYGPESTITSEHDADIDDIDDADPMKADQEKDWN